METRNNIWEELKGLNSSLAGVEKRNVFTVPAGYFDHLAGDVLMALGLQQEDDLSARFRVPDGYFDGLAASILDKVRAAEAAETAGEEIERLSPVLQALQQKQVYTVPEGYFEGLAVNLKHHKGDEEELSLSPLLAGLRNRPAYTVPTGYFDGLADQVLQKQGQQPARVVTMKWRSRLLKYAAAAVITGAMALGVVRFTAPRTAHQLVAMSTHFSNEEFEKGLEGVSDEEIIKYLENSGEGFNSVALTDAVNEKELPSEMDILLDDKAVDKFLNNIN